MPPGHPSDTPKFTKVCRRKTVRHLHFTERVHPHFTAAPAATKSVAVVRFGHAAATSRHRYFSFELAGNRVPSRPLHVSVQHPRFCSRHSKSLPATKIPTRDQCYKTFYICNLQIYIIRERVCPWQAFPA